MKIIYIILFFVILLVMVMQYLHLKDDLSHFWECLKKNLLKYYSRFK